MGGKVRNPSVLEAGALAGIEKFTPSELVVSVVESVEGRFLHF